MQDSRTAGRISIWTGIALFSWLSILRAPRELFALPDSARGFGPAISLRGALLTIGLPLVSGVLWSVGKPAARAQPHALVRLITIRTIAVIAATLTCVCVAAIAMDLRSIYTLACDFVPQPLPAPRSPDAAAFTARLLHVGITWPSGVPPSELKSGELRKEWTLALVTHAYWGLPWWHRKFVVISLEARGGSLKGGETYFVDATRSLGSVTRFLPAYEASCSRTRLLREAEIDLRVIRDGAPKNGARILGHTITGYFGTPKPVPGVKVIFRGPSDWLTTKSDKDGLFDLSGVPPGEYDPSVDYETDGRTRSVLGPDCFALSRMRYLKPGDVRDCTVWIK